jgi:hypothetical protein
MTYSIDNETLTATISSAYYDTLKKPPESVEYFNYFDSMRTNDARRTREMKWRNVTTKAAFNKNILVITGLLLDLNLTKKLVNVTFGAYLLRDETETLRKVDGKFQNVVLENDE